MDASTGSASFAAVLQATVILVLVAASIVTARYLRQKRRSRAELPKPTSQSGPGPERIEAPVQGAVKGPCGNCGGAAFDVGMQQYLGRVVFREMGASVYEHSPDWELLSVRCEQCGTVAFED